MSKLFDTAINLAYETPNDAKKMESTLSLMEIHSDEFPLIYEEFHGFSAVAQGFKSLALTTTRGLNPLTQMKLSILAQWVLLELSDDNTFKMDEDGFVKFYDLHVKMHRATRRLDLNYRSAVRKRAYGEHHELQSTSDTVVPVFKSADEDEDDS